MIQNFQEHSRNSTQIFQGMIKSKVEFPRKTKKNSCEISKGLNFLDLKFLRDVAQLHNFTKFPGVELLFAWNFHGYREKQKKFQGFFFKKVCPQLPCLFFSGIAHSKIIDLNRSYKALVQKEALTLCQDRAFASFSCVLSLASVLGRFTHLYCDTGSLGRGAPLHGK